MSSRAGLNGFVGRNWPTGHRLETPELEEWVFVDITAGTGIHVLFLLSNFHKQSSKFFLLLCTLSNVPGCFLIWATFVRIP